MGDKRSVCFGMVIAVVGLFHTSLMSMFAELERPQPQMKRMVDNVLQKAGFHGRSQMNNNIEL